jgi:hypothetical protein
MNSSRYDLYSVRLEVTKEKLQSAPVQFTRVQKSSAPVKERDSPADKIGKKLQRELKMRTRRQDSCLCVMDL